MTIDEARIRLASLPGTLPRPPQILEPTTLRGPAEAAPWTTRAAEPARDAAVLVLLAPGRDGQAHVILTERPTGDLRHSGQISFAGGARDATDDFPVGTALREAAEEVALDVAAAGVEVLGLLDTVDMRRISGFHVVPVLAIAAREPVLVPHQREVAAILQVPLSVFEPAAPIEIVEADREGWRIRYGAYRFGEVRIWGMTARILGQLGAVLDDSVTAEAAR